MNVKLLFLGLLLLLFTSQAYASLTDNLVAYYNLDETSGATLADVTGTYPVTHSGVTLNQTGKIGKAITINATINNFNIGYLGTNSSISFWHKYNSGTPSLGGIIFEIPITSNKYHQLLIDYNGTNYNFTSFSQCGGTNYNYTITDAINPSNYNMITVTWDSSSFYVYVNGVYNGTFTKGSNGSCNAINWRMGRHTNQNYDEIGIWGRTLTSDEITKLYNSGSGLTYPFNVNAIYADFDYTVNELQVDLNDTSIINDDAVIDSWEWLIDDVSVSTDQNYSFTGTEATDYNVCLIVQDTVLSLEDSTCQTISMPDTTPPVTTFESFQIPNTTSQSITLTCTDNNSGCQYINFRINNGDWNYYTIGDNPLTIIYNSSGNHNIQYFSTDNSDNNETTKTSNFTTYGKGRFTIKDQNSGLDLNGTQINFNGSDYVSGTNIYDFNLQELTATNTSYLFTISKTGYSTRYYQTDLNYFSSFDINFALIPDSIDSDVPFKVYETDQTTLFTNTYVEVKDSDTNWTIGKLKTNSSGETTFNLRLDDSNYNAIINNGAFTYVPVTVSILYPKNEETLVQITEKWKIEITQNLYASYSDLNTTKIIYLLPNTSLPYNIRISDMNGNYFPRSYAKTYPGNPLTDTLQPYLVSESTGLLTTINAISATTNQPLEGITFKVYKYISGLGRTFVEQLTTDSKGQALSLLVLGDSYEFEAYNGSVLLKNFPITATSTTIFFVLNLSTEVVTQPTNSGFSSTFTPGTSINIETIGNQGFSQTLNNFGDKTITIASTITQNGVNLAAPQNYAGSSDKTFTYTIAWSTIVKGTIIQKMVVTTSDGNVYTFTQNIQVIEGFGTGYDPIYGLQYGLRSDLVCSSDPLVPCYPLLVLAFLICLGVTIWATMQFGVYGGQSAGLIFLVGMILFTYLTWIPVWVTAGLVLIILAFIVNERR